MIEYKDYTYEVKLNKELYFVTVYDKNNKLVYKGQSCYSLPSIAEKSAHQLIQLMQQMVDLP